MNIKKILKVAGIFLLSVLVLVFVLLMSLRIPAVQNFVKDRLVTYLEDKIKTEVRLEKVYVGFPNSLEMRGLYLRGQKVDTLLYTKSLQVNLDILQLINSKADLTKIDLEGVNANVVRNEDGSFNFDYILDAFASNKEEEKKDSKPFILSLDKIDLRDIRLSFIDLQSKNDIALYFKNLSTRVQEFDLEKNSYGVQNIDLDGLRLKLKQDFVEEVVEKTAEKVDSLNAQKSMQIALKSINLTDFDIDYGDENTKTFAKVKFNELSGKVNKLDLPNSNFDVKNIFLKDADIQSKLHLVTSGNQTKETELKEENSALSLFLGKLVLDNVKVAYSNTAAEPSRSGMDFNYLNFSKLNTEVRNFKMKDGIFSGTINSAEIKENRGLDIQKFHTDFVYDKQQAYLKDLYLQTPKTVLRDEVVLDYNSIEQLSENLGEVRISANIPNSKIAFSDILLLAPQLKSTAPFSQYPNAILNLDTRLKGKVNDLLIEKLNISGLDKLKIRASGRIKNATNPDHLHYDLRIGEFSSTAQTVYKLVPKGTIPNTISLPSYFRINGTAKGTTQLVNANLKLASTLGDADLIANVNMSQKNKEIYDINAHLKNLNVGAIIQNKDLGIITGNIVAKGEGFDLETARINAKGDIKALDYNGYRYTNMNLLAQLNRGVYRIDLDSKDPNAELKLLATGVYSEKSPTVKINGGITKLHLTKLGFYKEPMILAGKIDADFSNLNPDFLNGYLNLQNWAISDEKEVFSLQEININALSTQENNQLSLKSQIADVELKGKYKLTQIFTALQHTLNQYYQFQKQSKLPNIDENQHFTINAKLKDDDLIRKFVPELISFETISLSGNYDADMQLLELEGKIPHLEYGQNILRGGELTIHNRNQALNYQLNLDSAGNESLVLNQLSLNGDIKDNIIAYNLTTKDDKNTTQFIVAGNVKSLDEVTEISLNPNGLMLNYAQWSVAEDNKLQISQQGILAENFKLNNGSSEIFLQSETSSPSSPLNVSIKDFKIEQILEIVKKDSLLAQGTINGTAQVRNITKNMAVQADLNISELKIYNNPIGDISAKVQNQSADVYDVNMALSGYENDVKILGTYNTKASSFNLDLNLNRLQMKTIQGFSMDAITKTEGYLSGNLVLQGTTEEPKILGNIKFNDVGLLVEKSGSDFRKINDNIAFTNRGIEFDRFNLKDKEGHSLVVNGQVLTKNYRDFAFNLDINTKEFKLVNSEKSNDALMYGILEIDANLRVKGDLDLPKVDGRLAVTKGTDFTFVLPQSTPTLQEREGIVEFIDRDQIALNKTIKTDSISSQSDIKGMDVNVNIELTKEAKLSIIVDKAAGDFVELQGEAELTGGIDPSGKTTLVGVYQVEKGAYELSMSALKRRFDIQKGSTITWTGEPTAASLDITAIYKTKAPPIDLLEHQLAGMSSAEMNQYKQQIPFNALLILSGELMKPEITFDITTDENNIAVSTAVLDNVNTKLNQLKNDEAERNKQVFALLLLNRFIGENPFQSEAGLSAGTIARQSVSKILSQQLNNLAADLIAGVDLTFDLESSEDYSSGKRNERTDLNVNLSKNLLNDRLKVSVGSNFGVEGEARQNEQITNIAGDVTLDYKISRDGRYMLRAYRTNQYQVALQGQVVETGVGFIITLDYDKLQEVFRKKNKEKIKINRNKDTVQFK